MIHLRGADNDSPETMSLPVRCHSTPGSFSAVVGDGEAVGGGAASARFWAVDADPTVAAGAGLAGGCTSHQLTAVAAAPITSSKTTTAGMLDPVRRCGGGSGRFDTVILLAGCYVMWLACTPQGAPLLHGEASLRHCRLATV